MEGGLGTHGLTLPSLEGLSYRHTVSGPTGFRRGERHGCGMLRRRMFIIQAALG
jgi:hypothetical protein